MARFGSLDTQYFDDAGDPLVSGKIYFYETGTTTQKDTFADVNLTIPNTNPVILTAAGRQPNIFFDGVAKAILTKSDNTQILVRDPVGETESNFGDAWVASKTYVANDVVQGSNGEFYRSLINGNVNNNPISTTGSWTFLYSIEWSAGTTYKLGSVVTLNQLFYQSLQNANLNKDPSTQTAWWVPIQLVWSSTATYGLNANVVGTDGILYTSIQAGNINNPPATSPLWWIVSAAAQATVNLATQVSGILGTANGGTGSSSPINVGTIASSASNYSFTSTPTLLVASPTNHGMKVTLPNATTMSRGGIVHAVENRTDFFIRVHNAADTLLGFVPPQTYCPIGLSDNSTSAGVWDIVNGRRDGISSQLETTVVTTRSNNSFSAIDMDGDIEIVWGSRSSDNNLTAVAHRSSTGAYGTPVVVRAASISSNAACVKHTSTQALFVSCPSSSTALEAVIVSVNTSTLALTVNTAATATLSSNGTIDSSVNLSQALLNVPSLPNSFVILYRLSAGTAGIRAISVSGTTVTVGAETALDAGTNPIMVATADRIIAASHNNSTLLYTRPYTISGSTITSGTGTTTSIAATSEIRFFFALGSRWCVLFTNGSQSIGGIVTLTGTTTTISTATLAATNLTINDAIAVSSSKVLVRLADATTSLNILTDTAGTASAGTAVSASGTAGAFFWVSGTSVGHSSNSGTSVVYDIVDCSGSSPVRRASRLAAATQRLIEPSRAAGDMSSKDLGNFYGSTFFRSLNSNNITFGVEVTPAGTNYFTPLAMAAGSLARGRNDRERWSFYGSNLLTKFECAP